MISTVLDVVACVVCLIALEGWWRANGRVREHRARYRAALAREHARYLELESRMAPLLDLPPLLNDRGDHGSAHLVAWRASTEPGLRVVCAAATIVDVDLQFDQVFRLVPRYMRALSSGSSRVIRLTNGSRITFRVAEDNLRGLDADMVWWGSRNNPVPIEVAMAVAPSAPSLRELDPTRAIIADPALSTPTSPGADTRPPPPEMGLPLTNRRSM